MKHLKLFGLVVLAGALLLTAAGAGTALGAANLCTVQESPCKEANLWATGTILNYSLKSGTKAKLASTTGETLEECTSSTLKGKLEKIEAATSSIESLTWGTCNFPTTTTLFGKLEVEHIASTHNGTVKADGETQFTINGGFFGSCLYGLSSKADVGELKEGKPATLVVNAVVNKLSGSATACPETAKWTAEYTLAEPAEKTLSVEEGFTPAGSVFCTIQESPCSETNRWASGTTLDFTLKAETKAKLVSTEGETLDECTGSTVKGKTEKAEFVTGTVESLTWTGCTFATSTTKLGGLEVTNATLAHNGTVKGTSEIGVTINALFFGSCIYGITNGTDLGELKEGKPATFVANATAEKLTGSAAACPETAKWTAEYTLTEPAGKTLSVEKGTAPVKGTVFCTAQETTCSEANRWAAGTTLDFSKPSGSSSNLVSTGGETIDQCSGGTIKGKIEKSVGITVPIESLTWSGCTFPTTTTILGKFEVTNAITAHNGTVKSDAEIGVTINTVFFGTCVYGVKSGTDLGELKEGKPATFAANAIAIKLTGSAAACPETTKWVAEYTLTEPKEKTLSVETN